MLDIVLLNVFFIVVPILVYLLYIVYDNVIDDKGKDLFFTFAIFTSIYLVIKYSFYFEYSIDIIKVILLICFFKRKIKLSVVVALLMVVYFGYINNNGILLLVINYYIQICLFVTFKNINDKYKLLIFLIVEILFGIILNNNYLEVIMFNIIYVVCAYILYNLIDRLEKIIDIYGTFKVIEYEKEFRNSLFQVTHEIKNPIAVCKGYIDMLDVNNNKQVNKYIPIIKEEIDRTLTLMNDFLDLTKISIKKNIIDISLLLDDVCSCVEPLLSAKNIHFIFDIIDDEIFIDGDYDRLKQVFINLIKNSVEAIDKDKIGIIKLKMSINKNVIVTIEDNGCGMSKDEVKKIGDAFYTTKEKGTGLGVKLSTEIIEQHDGTIKYKTKEKKGTIVTIKLPLYN